jgi:branched-chain amino acid transport system permease protein
VPGFRLANPDRRTLHLDLSPAARRTLVFALATGRAPHLETTLEEAPDRIVEGLRYGLIIAMCAVGLSLIFGTTGLVNFSHGDMVTFGALMAFLFNRTLGLDLLVAVPLAVVAGALLGGAYNGGVWRPLRRRGTGLVAMMIVSFGVGLAVRWPERRAP